MRLKLSILLIFLSSILLGVDMLYVDGLTHFIDVGNFLIRVSENDLQFGAIYQHEKASVRKIGFLRIKEGEAQLKAGFTVGKSWSAIVSFDVEGYGLTPANYRLFFFLSPDESYAFIDATQKLFLGNYAVNISSFDVFGPVTMGMSRVYLKIQSREIGFYALDRAVFAGFYPLTRGQTGDEGFFMGVGWHEGFSGALATKFRVPLGKSSLFFDLVLALGQEKASVGIRGEWIGEGFKFDTCFIDGRFVFRVSF